MYQSRLKRAGLFAFGLLALVATVGLVLDHAPLLQIVGVGAFGVAAVAMPLVPRQQHGEGVERSGDRIVFRGGRGRAAAMTVGGVGLTLGSALLLAGPLVVKVFAVLAMLLFGLATIAAIRQLVRGSYVEITPQTLAWSGGAGGFSVTWNAIESAYRHETHGVQELYIGLRDPSALRATGVIGALSGVNRRFLGADVALPLSQLTADPDVVEAAVQRMVDAQALSAKSSEQELMQ
jgi:hypothetical protein